MYYDLHIHSALSPCAEDEMTPNNICNMAMIKGLGLIAVTDHNSTGQLKAFSEVASGLGLRVLYGAELQTSEEVHVLALFSRLADALSLQTWIDEKMPDVPNRKDFFGNQYICDAKDNITAEEPRLLLVSLNADLTETVAAVHAYGGKAVLAHVLDRENSVTTQLGFIPQGLNYDGLEIKSEDQKAKVLAMHPWITEDSTNWFINSDAHRLVEISEPVNVMDEITYSELWGD